MLGVYRILTVATVMTVLAASSAWAQQQQSIRIRGTIEKLDGDTLSVKSREGAEVAIKLTGDVRVVDVVNASLADIKEGFFIGSAAMPQADGTQKALEVHIFPEAMRGTGEGHYAWDLSPNSTMTNGNIENQVISNDGQELAMKYKDGEKKIIVPANIEVVMFAPATVADIKAGQKFFVPRAKKLDDGTIEAGVIVIGSHGVDPPM